MGEQMRTRTRVALLIPVVIVTAVIGVTASSAELPVTVPGNVTAETGGALLSDVAVSNTGSADEVVFTFVGDTLPTVEGTVGVPPFRTIPGDVVDVPGTAFVDLRMFPASGVSFGASCSNRLGLPPTPAAGETLVGVYFGCGDDPGIDFPAVRSSRLVPTGTPSEILAAAMGQLLAGPTAIDRAAGLGSVFSDATAGKLLSASIASDGSATIDFDPTLSIPDATSSFGVGQLLRELDATVFQFSGVTSATYALGGSCEAFFRPTPIGNFCEVRTPANGADAVISVTYTGPDTVTGPSVNVTQASQTEDFEGQLVWVIGLRTDTDVTVTTASEPARVIVTVPHLAPLAPPGPQQPGFTG